MNAVQQPDGSTQLESGKAVEREIVGGQQHVFHLALGAGEYVDISVEQRGIDLVVQVSDSNGKVMAEFDSESRSVGLERVGLVAAATVQYDVRIKPKYAKAGAGRYEIRVGGMHPATEDDRSLFDAHKLSTEASDLESAGKYDEARQLLTRALAPAEQILGPNAAYVGYLLARLAEVQRTRGDYANAEELFQRAISVDTAALGREDPQTAYALLRLGALYNAMDDHAKAEPLLQEALEITERTLGPDHPRIVTCLMAVSALHHDREDFERALSELQRAMAIAEKTFEPDDFSMTAIVNNLGDVYLDLGDYDRAELLTERALGAVEKRYGQENPRVSYPLLNLGVIAHEKKQYERALERLRRAEQIREKTLGSRHPQTAEVVLTIGNVYRSLGDYPKALDTYQRVLEALESSAGPYHKLTLMTLRSTAMAYSAQGDVARAIAYQTRAELGLEKSIDLNLAVGSEREKFVYLSSVSAHTDRTISLDVHEAPTDAGATALAALVLLQRKGRLLDALSGELAALRRRLDTDDQKLLDQLRTTTEQLAKLALNGAGKVPPDEYRRQLAQLEDRRGELQAEISGRSAEFRGRSQPVTLDAVRAAIPRDAALIEFARYRPVDPKAERDAEAYGVPHYIAYVLRHEGDLRFQELGEAEDIDDAATALRQALRDSRRRDVRHLARAVDDKTMRPVRALAGDATRLLISPDGALSLIPFETLVDEQGHYEVERYRMTYLTSGRDLLRMEVARASRSDPVVIADPLFGEPEDAPDHRPNTVNSAPSRALRRSVTTGKDLSSVYFARLTGTAEEARVIKSLFPEATVLTRQQATKAALASVDAPRMLHIATHGFFLQEVARDAAHERADGGRGTRSINAAATIENPLLRSGLALSGANLNSGATENGIFTALEASNLNLWGTKLVTLSACDTGVGEIKTGEGVYGLRRAFFLAGAETLVMSLWPVSDYVTREMMTAYYGGLKEGLGRGEALRQAQLTMLARKGRQHPFYWASFIQAGEWANLDGRR